MAKKIALIVAKSKNNQIGKNNDLLWHLPLDMAFFKATTQNMIVLTGRKNYESIPEKYRPLPNRENWVLTRSKSYKAPGAIIFTSFDEAMEEYKSSQSEQTLMIIGGGQIYNEAIEKGVVQEMFITEVDVIIEGDTVFPEFDEQLFTKTLISHHLKDEKHPFDFSIYHYLRN